MGETIKVLCYKSKTLSNGEHPLMLCVCKDRKRKFQSLGISVKAENWDFKRNEPNLKCPNRERIKILINEKIHEIQTAALDKRIAGKDFTAKTLLENQQKPKTRTVGEYFLTYIQSLKDEHRLRYAGMFKVSYSSFIKFNGHLDIPFSDVDVAWLKKYDTWARKENLVANTIATRVRHLRVVFNLAIMEKAIRQDCYPFHAYKVSKLNQQTNKRAITKEDILNIISYKGTTEMETLAVDLFAFSYLCAGINFIDIAKLQHLNIVDNKIVYTRSKTKKTITIPLQAKAVELIDKYRKAKSPYLFPILFPYHKTDEQIANRLHKVLSKINRDLKHIGKEIGLSIPLTTYVARHSYATVLKRSGVAISIISESLGHSSERVTQIYLDSFDNEQINEAMKNLL